MQLELLIAADSPYRPAGQSEQEAVCVWRVRPCVCGGGEVVVVCEEYEWGGGVGKER